MTVLVEYLVDGVSLGGIYALLALGVALLFGVMNLINLAQGELITAAAYILIVTTGLPIAVSIVLAVLLAVVLGLAMDRIAFRPIRGAGQETLLVTSFAVSYLLQNIAVVIFGALPRSGNILPSLQQSVNIGSIPIGRLNIVEIAVTVVALVLLGLFLRKTRWGIQMRAAAEDFGMARLTGVRSDTVIGLAFALSGVLAGLAAVMLTAQAGTVTPTLGSGVILFGFVATVIGGIGSLRGAIVAGLALGIISVLLQGYLPVGLRYFQEAFVFGAVILLLTTRPQGLWPSRFTTTRVG